MVPCQTPLVTVDKAEFSDGSAYIVSGRRPAPFGSRMSLDLIT